MKNRSLAQAALLCFATSALALTGCSSAADVDVAATPQAQVAPEGKGNGPPSFTLAGPATDFSSATGTITFQNVTVTTNNHKVVINDPASFSPSTPFSDTQSGSCWQKYESLGNPIPANTSCTIQVGFLPTAAGPVSATMTVTRCTSWTTDPTYGFIVCSAFDSSQTLTVNGTGL
jgi:hypothetical protein